tara:strand:+ start:81 stop:236 length:156 start_codon:yes stop_codon:yes gene_type:complete
MERVDFNLRSKSHVRAVRGTIIPNKFKNPTRNPKRFLPTHKNLLNPNISKE